MVGDISRSGSLPGIHVQLDELCGQLADFNGYRSVWLDAGGQVWHAEPDELLEDLGHTYVGSFFRPSTDELGLALSQARPWGALARAPHVGNGSLAPDYAPAAVPALA